MTSWSLPSRVRLRWFAVVLAGLAIAGCDAIPFARPTVREQGLLKGVPAMASGMTAGVYWEARGAWFGREWCMGVATSTHAAGACEEPPDPRTPLRVFQDDDDEIAFLYGVALDDAARVAVTVPDDGTALQPVFIEATGPVDFWVLPLSPQDRGREVLVEAFDATDKNLAEESIRTP